MYRIYAFRLHIVTRISPKTVTGTEYREVYGRNTGTTGSWCRYRSPVRSGGSGPCTRERGFIQLYSRNYSLDLEINLL
jgi:hypothetical protein